MLLAATITSSSFLLRLSSWMQKSPGPPSVEERYTGYHCPVSRCIGRKMTEGGGWLGRYSGTRTASGGG